MSLKKSKLNFTIFSLLIGGVLLFNSCNENKKISTSENPKSDTKPNDVIPFFQHWNLILGDGSNVSQAIDYTNKDFFYTAKDEQENWVVFKTPNAGNTHGTSNYYRV